MILLYTLCSYVDIFNRVRAGHVHLIPEKCGFPRIESGMRTVRKECEVERRILDLVYNMTTNCDTSATTTLADDFC